MGMNMVTTVMAFSVSAFFVLFVFTRLLCARLHLSRAAAAAQGYNVERGTHGLEPSVVTTFPTVKLGDGGQQPPPVQEESQCTVCLEEYEAKDVVRVLPACGHAFHATCIDAWLRQHPTCPVCRASLRARNGCRATPVDYSLLVAGADAAATVQHVPASSSGASPQAVGRQRQTDDTGRADGLLEIVSEEPASSRDPSPAVAAAGGNHSLCAADAERQSGEGSAGASEH
ncbi:putative RING-H2 finger protein ATL36 isoform X2 [Zea mays]|nr:putative RING-H2 finger protein ATL36 isoform X2 [Zea mays]AQK71434.1 RING-H2 finger protein ATL7 [Zea mays]|eukprot:XP_020394143.1 putative RING-H2 finger protein ATL36 isoform X2 [Zea mays]